MGNDVTERRKKLLERFAQADTVYMSSWKAHHQELSDWMRPRKARFLASEMNDGSKTHNNIINGTAATAIGIGTAGMSSSVTNASRPWFKMGTSNPKLAKLGSVKQWLHDVETEMYATFARSNFYDTSASMYGDLLQFGTATFHIEPDALTDIRCRKFPVGQFRLSRNDRGDADCFYRKFQMTVRQLISRFGEENVSRRVRQLQNENKPNEPVEVLHAIEPNEQYEAGKIGARGKRYSSCWLEYECSEPGAGFLKESGYSQLRTMAPCWEVDAEDDYGTGPGMRVLGDVKALQLLEKEKLKLIEKASDPPMKGPATLKNQRVGMMPGDYNPIELNSAPLEPAMSVNHIPQAIAAVSGEIQRHEFRINQGFYADLWMMLAMGGDTQKTAREIVARESEKMLQLGPVLERLFGDFLRPTIEIVFAILMEAGKLPPPPKEMWGQELKIEFISVLAQALKLVGITSYERLSGFVMQWHPVDPQLKDKVNTDELLEDYADRLGIPPDVIRTDEQVQQIRDARAQAMAQQQQAEQSALQAKSLKDLSGADLEGDNAASRLVDNLGGATPGVEVH